MKEDLEKIWILTEKLQIITPPGQFGDYLASSKTYLIEEDDENEIIADNPYIIEYLLFNNKKYLIPQVSNMVYLEKLSIRNSKTLSTIFFYEQIAHFLHFEISECELPVFKIFIDLLAYKRKNTTFFPWDINEFLRFSKSVSNKMTELQVISLHQRLCEFQKQKFPGEALKNVFLKK